MGNVYTIYTGPLTVSAATTLIIVRPSTTAGLRVIRATAGQVGALTSENVDIQIGIKSSAFPTVTAINVDGSTFPLIAKHDTAGAASTITGGTSVAAGTAGINATSEGAGALAIKVDAQFNSIVGWDWVPTRKEEEINLRASSADAIVLRVPATPIATGLWRFSLTLEEQ